jgi:cell wall-associated NlpC family hydrolase
MNKLEQQLRNDIVAEAISWIGTPYHPSAYIKGAGVDCATFIYSVLLAVKTIEPETIGIFSSDWFCHTDEEVYMRRVVRHAYKLVEGRCYPTLEAKPGCICMIRTSNSRVFNHGAIVTKWPMVVHAVPPCVDLIDVSRHPMTTGHQVSIYDPVVKAMERMEYTAIEIETAK